MSAWSVASELPLVKVPDDVPLETVVFWAAALAPGLDQPSMPPKYGPVMSSL